MLNDGLHIGLTVQDNCVNSQVLPAAVLLLTFLLYVSCRLRHVLLGCCLALVSPLVVS